MFQTTGNTKKDIELANRIKLHDARVAEGMCPNGCGPLTIIDDHSEDCKKCHFVHYTTGSIIAGRQTKGTQ